MAIASMKAVIFSIFAVILVVIGILNIITSFEENKCEMTWMFEQPQYVKVPMPKSANKKFPNYGLYVYGEGHYANMLTSMKMTGIPVLFIPGNAGSYKQVRSLGSVAFRRAVDKGKKYHFNFFSVDLNEEFSGLYGICLKGQTEYVGEVIKKIFSLYKNAPVKPKTIILVGHSMGGLIARGVFTLKNFDASQVNTIFMQATPNQYPVVSIDRELAAYHKKVNDYWTSNNNSTLSHITLVSSGGGEYDIQVRDALTSLDGITDESRSISTSTTHTPKAWVSTDHRCIVWCKQVVFGFVRSMFDIVDENEHTVSEDVKYRMSVFKHHFLQNAGSIGHVTNWPDHITLNPKVKWTIMDDPVFKWQKDKVTTETFLAIPVIDYEEEDRIVIVANIRQDSWVCACELKEGEKQCSKCKDLSSTGNVLPPLYSNKKVVHIDLDDKEMAKVTHIVIVVPALDMPVEVIGEIYAQDKRHLSNSVPGLMEVIMSYPESITKGAMILDLGSNVAFYKLKLYNLNNVVKVYTTTLHTYKCKETKVGEHAGSVLRFHVPWSNVDAYQYSKYGQNGNITLRVQYIPPDPVVSPTDPEFSFDDLTVVNDYVEVFIHMDPTCSYKVRVTLSLREILGQLVRFYGVLMPAFCVAALLITLVHQLRCIADDGCCPSVLNSVWQIKPYFVVPVALLLQFILQLAVVKKALAPLNLPDPDNLTLYKQGIWFRGAPLLLYVLGLAIITFHAGVIELVLLFKGTLAGLIFGWLPSIFGRLLSVLMVLVCLAGVGLAATVCGSLGIFITYFLTFIQVLRTYCAAKNCVDKATKSRYHLYQTLFMIWLWMLLLNSPSLVVFGKSVQASEEILPLQPLRGDPSKLAGILTTVTFLIIFLCNTPIHARSTLRAISYIIHLLVVLMLVFSIVTLYRITYVVLASLLVLALVHVYGKVSGKAVKKVESKPTKPKID